MADKLINISADSMDDFMDQISDKVGEGDGVMGNTEYHTKFKIQKASDGTIAKITFELKQETTRAHWSGGKPDANNKKAIQAAEDLNKKHEAKHRKLAEDICKREFAKAEKALKGKDEDDADDALEAINDKIDAANEALDKKEGVTDFTEKSDGSFTVKQVGN